MSIRAFVLLPAVAALWCACSSEHDRHSSGTASGTDAPAIQHVEKMVDSLHVSWSNPSAACDAIEGERKAQMPDGTAREEYKQVFSVPGSVDNKHDATATEDMTYTYRLRCKRGAAFSAYSNEVGANPVK